MQLHAVCMGWSGMVATKCALRVVVAAARCAIVECMRAAHRRYTPAAAVKVLEEASPVMPCG